MKNEEALWNTDTEYDYDNENLYIYGNFSNTKISLEKWNKMDESSCELLLIELNYS